MGVDKKKIIKIPRKKAIKIHELVICLDELSDVGNVIYYNCTRTFLHTLQTQYVGTLPTYVSIPEIVVGTFNM